MIKLLTRFVLCLPMVLLLGSDPAFGRAGTDSARLPKDFLRNDAEEDLLSLTPYLAADDSMTAPFSLRQVPDGKVKAFQRDPDFAYANDPDYWKSDRKFSSDDPAGSWLYSLMRSRAIRISLLVLFLLVVAYGLYRLAKENSFRWLDSPRKKNKVSGTAGLPQQEPVADLERAIIRYAEAGNYSLAVQYLYIRLIRVALERNVIQFRSSFTNTQIAEAFKDPRQAGDFRYLATAYEYVFYGGFAPEPEQFQALQQKFNAFHQNLQD